MKTLRWCALACATMVLSGCPENDRPVLNAAARPAASTAAVARTTVPTAAPAPAATEVTLTLATRSFDATASEGEGHHARLSGSWGAVEAGSVHLQASDSAGLYPTVTIRAPRTSRYRIVLTAPATTPTGDYAGTLTVRACADAQCIEPYPDASRSIDYTLRVDPVGEWETLQRNAGHDGHVPVHVEPTRYRVAWTWSDPGGEEASPVVTDAEHVYVTGGLSLFALRKDDGAVQWRRAFDANRLNPPAATGGVVYAATTGHEDTYLYALRGSDGHQLYQSAFATQWASILNPVVHGGRAYVNSGYYGGVVYAFDEATGASAWTASAGTYGENTPAVDDGHAYIFNGDTLAVLDTADGSLHATIGPTPYGVQDDHHGTVTLGSGDRAFSYSQNAWSWREGRQLVAYSISAGTVSWRSTSLYSGLPAVTDGVVYATSNETRTLDALDEATGRVLWSWRAPEYWYEFIGNVVATDNMVFASTGARLYAIDRATRRTRWSVATPGTVAISADRMLFVTGTWSYYGGSGMVTAYSAD